MIDLLEGQGKLELWDSPRRQFDVRYVFEIEIRYPTRPGFPRARVQSYPEGRIATLNGEVLEKGIYRLYDSNSNILKVQNLGSGRWFILRNNKPRCVMCADNPALDDSNLSHDFVKIPIDRAKLRERVQGMSNKDLREFGKTCEHICSPKSASGKPPAEDIVIQLEEAREEWKRRMRERKATPR